MEMKHYLICYYAQLKKVGDLHGSIVLNIEGGIRNQEVLNHIHLFIADGLAKELEDEVDHLVLQSVTNLPEWEGDEETVEAAE